MALKDSSAGVEQQWIVLPHQATVGSEDHVVFCLSRETKDMTCIFKKPLWVLWRLDFREVKGEAEKLVRRLLQLSKLRMMVVGATVVEMKKMARFGIEFERKVYKDQRS